MDEFDILKELEKLDDDIEPGFLSELRFEAPEELHSRIMNSIRQEIKPRSRFNYKRYTAVAVAAFFVCVYTGGGKSLLHKYSPDTLRNSISENQTQTDKVKTVVDSKAMLEKTNLPKAVANNDTPKVQFGKSNTPIIKPTPTKSTPNKTTVGKKVIKSNKLAKGNNSQKVAVVPNINKVIPRASKPTATKPPLFATATNGSPTVSSSQKTTNNVDSTVDSSNDINKNTGLTTIEIVPSEKSSSDNQNTPLNDPSKIIPADEVNPKDENTNLADNNNTSSSAIDFANFPSGPKMASLPLDSFVNYEINLNMSQISIIQFIKETGTKISEVVYKISKSDYDRLDKILEENGVSKTEVNNQYGQFVIVKMIMY